MAGAEQCFALLPVNAPSRCPHSHIRISHYISLFVILSFCSFFMYISLCSKHDIVNY
jgi:hypothetical protein